MTISRESTEEKRARLLADPQVQDMIRHRAFDLYQQRAGRPGNPADDWFQAEGEVLTFWIEKELNDSATQLVEGAPVSIEEPGSFAPVEETPAVAASVEEINNEAPAKPKKAAAKPATPRKTKKLAEETKDETETTAKKASPKKTTSKKSDETKSKTRKSKASQPEAKA